MKRCPWLTVSLLLLMVSISQGCNLPSAPLAVGDLATPTETAQILPGESGGGVTTPHAPTEQPCGYMWASQPLPDVSSDIQAMLEESGVEQVRVSAEAFGENCVLPDGEVARFLVMQTDIRILLGVENVNDLNALGDLAAKVLPVVLGLPEEMLPGPNEGYIGLQFSDADGQALNVWLPKAAVRELMKHQANGSALIELLQRK